MNFTPTFLITDDDLDLRDSLGSLFNASGVRTLFAGDGKEACQLVQTTEVHLVLIDFHMPRMTGLEALRVIKQHKQQLPVILMSAELNQEMSEAVIAADAYSVHTKPIRIDRIRRDIASAMRLAYDWTIDW